MSVLIPDDEVFNYLYSGIEKAAYNTTCDEWYSHTIRSHFIDKDVEAEGRRLVESWMQLNDLSYCIKYDEEPETMIRFRRRTLHKQMEVHQLLKYAQCVDYNIEQCTIESSGRQLPDQSKNDLLLLQNWISDIAMSIIGQLPQYKDAKWSEL